LYPVKYRAGATTDVEDDRGQGIDPSKPAKRIFEIPVLSLASVHLCRRFDVKGIWDDLTVVGKHQFHQIGGENTGHFIVNEEKAETAERLTEWLEEHWA
jgi:haloacetate dehalogenase